MNDRLHLLESAQETTQFSVAGNLIAVGTDGNVGTWNGFSMDNRGDVGGWTLKMLTFDPSGTMWSVGTQSNVGKWTGLNVSESPAPS